MIRFIAFIVLLIVLLLCGFFIIIIIVIIWGYGECGGHLLHTRLEIGKRRLFDFVLERV